MRGLTPGADPRATICFWYPFMTTPETCLSQQPDIIRLTLRTLLLRLPPIQETRIKPDIKCMATIQAFIG